MALLSYLSKFRSGCHGGSRPSRTALAVPTAALTLSASDVEMASRPRRRIVAEGLHGARDAYASEESASLVNDGAALLNDKIFAAEGVEYSHLPITGNIYRVIAYSTPNTSGDCCEALLANFVVYLMAVQVLAPTLMFSYAVKHIDWSKGRWTFVAGDLFRDDFEKALIMTLGYMFLVPFLANLIVFCRKNMEEYLRLRAVSLYLIQQGGLNMSMFSLTYGCMVHCYITPLVMVVTWYLTATSSSPIDITMNMLGLTFVVAMDQLAADFADTLGYYLWDDQKTGDFVYDTLKGNTVRDGGSEYQIDNPDIMTNYRKPWWYWASNTLNWSLMITILMLFSFYRVAEVEKPSEVEKELSALKAQVAVLQSQVAALSKP